MIRLWADYEAFEAFNGRKVARGNNDFDFGFTELLACTNHDVNARGAVIRFEDLALVLRYGAFPEDIASEFERFVFE
jgi:hypothetical protein